MNQTENKHILNALKETFEDTSLPNSYNEVRSLDETMDLISELKKNMQELFKEETRLRFMISEVQTCIKRRL